MLRRDADPHGEFAELEVAGAVAAFGRIVATDLPAFNQQMAGRIPALSVKAP